MKRIIIAALVCVVLSLIPLQPTEITLNILYGLIGVLFSVAMSLIIAFDGSKIKNSELKKVSEILFMIPETIFLSSSLPVQYFS